jgi:16S rRNA (adenine1518-N6/adenine1519-N6)-dimethyltransferase
VSRRKAAGNGRTSSPVRKRFGQNFLTDPNVIDQIISTINPVQSDQILEIGPGRGALTELLIRSGCHLELVEIDRDLVDRLTQQFGTGIRIYSADVLKFDFSQLEGQAPVRVVGNLPYNISTPLLFRLFQFNHLFDDLTFMLQLEVVNRITAEPGSSDYGRLTIMSNYFSEAQKLFAVPPEAFTPMPKVNSAIIRLVPKRDRTIEVKNIKVLEQLLITAFSKRRKTVRNALRSYLTDDDLVQLNIDPGLRPENLRPEEYFRCANYITDNLPA